jgi:hypothetical protein
MLDVLTLLNKVERVSRLFELDNFVAVPGIWAEVVDDGSIKNVVTDTPAKCNKLVFGGVSDNPYENNDTKAGRVTTIESHGVRCKVDSEGYDGTVNVFDDLVVATGAGIEGKLVSVAETTETGIYEVVARAEEVNDTEGWIIFKTLSPSYITLT